MHPPDSFYPLLQLPQELLEYILDDVPSHADISNLSQSCKALHVKTTGRLYNHINLTWKASDTARPLKFDRQHVAQSLRPSLLLQTILARPTYAQTITHVKLQSMVVSGYWSSWDVRPRHRRSLPVRRKLFAGKGWTTANQRLAMAAINGVATKTRRDGLGDSFTVIDQFWYDSVLQYDLDATIALLICMCPNLASLHLGFHIGDDVVFIPTVLWHLPAIQATEQLPRSGSLRKITMGYPDIGGQDEEEPDMWTRGDWLHPHLDWKGYWTFFRCLIIQTIEMNLMDEVACEGLQKMESPPLCSNLTTLRLYDSSVTPDTLAKLLSCTPALRTLDYEYWTAREEWLDCGPLNAAFNIVKRTLEHLRFESRIEKPSPDVDSLVNGMCTFRDFPVLSSLQLPPAVLLGYMAFCAPRLEEVIPPSMEKLCLTDDFLNVGWCAEELTLLLKDFVKGDWRTSFPQLRQVHVPSDSEWLSEPEDAYDYLQKLCEESGLKYGP